MFGYVPLEWLCLVTDELCVDEAPREYGEEVYCQLTVGHGGRHYNRDLRRFW